MSRIDWEYADQFALKNRALKTIAAEAFSGEERLADVDMSDLQDLLANGILKADSRQSSGGSIKTRIGKRNAHRDSVGGFR